MGERDGVTIKIPFLIAKDLDRWLETEVAKKNGIKSKTDLIVRLLVDFMADYEKEYGLFASRESVKGGKPTKPLD